MKIRNIITFDGERTSLSSTGNTEWYEFTITSGQSITISAVKSIAAIYGMGGQTFSCDEMRDGDLYIYKCKATCYCN
jgi:hypothetical protein